MQIKRHRVRRGRETPAEPPEEEEAFPIYNAARRGELIGIQAAL